MTSLLEVMSQFPVTGSLAVVPDRHKLTLHIPVLCRALPAMKPAPHSSHQPISSYGTAQLQLSQRGGSLEEQKGV